MNPCNTCPFLKKTPLEGAPDWLKDVIRLHKQDPFFNHTCHKTDPKADGYVGGKKVTSCAGHIQMIMNAVDGTPGHGGVYNSIAELAETYLAEWTRELKRRKSENSEGFKKSDRD